VLSLLYEEGFTQFEEETDVERRFRRFNESEWKLETKASAF
jgi:hypothetical protein